MIPATIRVNCCPVCGKPYPCDITVLPVRGENMRHTQERVEEASLCHDCFDWAHLETFCLIVASGHLWGEANHV